MNALLLYEKADGHNMLVITEDLDQAHTGALLIAACLSVEHVEVVACMYVAMAAPVRNRCRAAEVWLAAESSHLPPTSVTMHFHAPSPPSSRFSPALPLSI